MGLSNQYVPWKEVTVFFIVAVLASAPFRLGLLSFEEYHLPYGLNVLYKIFRGVGPLIGYITVFYLLRSKVNKKLTFLGENKVVGILSMLPIWIGLVVVGVENQENINKHFFGFISGFTLIMYALCEEYGWRGYLQQALEPIKLPTKIIIIGTLWYIWHLNFLNPNIAIKMHLIHYFSLLAGTWGLLKISEVTSSLLFVSSVHLTFNILMDVDCSFYGKIGIFVISIITWVCLILYLRQKFSN
jgi:membrane protease YdiL (CAAX protease family)